MSLSPELQSYLFTCIYCCIKMGLRYLLLTAKLLWSKFSFPPHRFHLLVVVVQRRLFYLRSFRFLYLFRHLTLMLQILLIPALLDPTGSKLPKLVGCFGAKGLVTTTSFPFCSVGFSQSRISVKKCVLYKH